MKFHCLSRNDANKEGGDEKTHCVNVGKKLSARSWRCCQLPQIPLCPGDDPNQRAGMHSRKSSSFLKEAMPDEAGRNWLLLQRAAALVWVYFHSDSSMCGGAALGHLSLCCKDSSWISCVATSERILPSFQKLQTLPYGCYTINQGTYRCYFCCPMLTTPQQFCFCFIHNIITERFKSLTSLGFIKLVSVQIEWTEDAC